MTVREMRYEAARIRSALASAEKEVAAQHAAIGELRAIQTNIEAVADIVSKAAQAAQENFAASVAGVVTECLNSVYPDNPYDFRLEFRECAGKTVVDALLYRDGEPLDPMASTGGGVWDVLAFALRVAIAIITADDYTRMFMAFDEPFKFLHGVEKLRRAYETMEAVQERFGLTILCVRQH